MPFRPAILIALTSLAVLPACREAKVTSYRVPKEEPLPSSPVPAGANNMAAATVPTAHGEGLSWTAPAHWAAQAPTAMRKGSYAIAGPEGTTADMSITAFPGDVGGELANLNRWRGQIQLDPLPPESLPANLTSLQVHGLELKYVEMTNLDVEPPQRILGAMVNFEGNSWFFKLMGPADLVSAEKPNFLAFLHTVEGHHH